MPPQQTPWSKTPRKVMAVELQNARGNVHAFVSRVFSKPPQINSVGSELMFGTCHQVHEA